MLHTRGCHSPRLPEACDVQPFASAGRAGDVSAPPLLVRESRQSRRRSWRLRRRSRRRGRSPMNGRDAVAGVLVEDPQPAAAPLSAIASFRALSVSHRHSAAMHAEPSRLTARQMMNKVPEITLYFWVIKVLCTTVGETASDYLAGNLNLGLTKTTFITGALLIVVLVAQFRLRRYVAGVYWLGIVLISVVGTQITDNLTDNLGVSLVTTTIVFSVLLAAAFGAWYASERTLSIHTIYSTRREAFYWLAVLFTFALGTTAGDLSAERLNLGYWVSALIFAGVIAAVAVAHYRFKLNAIAAFWIAYILTRPLGASLGDYLSQPRSSGGLGLGTTATSFLFLAAILIVVVYLSV